MFSKHHYLDHAHNNAARVYVAYINDEIAGFISVLPQPGFVKNAWRVHRLVVLPDYQGIGIGIRMLNDIGELYKIEGLLMRIQSSTPSLLNALNRPGSGWNCLTYGRAKSKGGYTENIKKKAGKKITLSNLIGRMSASFYYVGQKQK